MFSSNQKEKPAPSCDLVLIGGGHAHVHVIRMFGTDRYRQILVRNSIQVTLICKDIQLPSAGMMSDYVAGHYTYDEIHIDLIKLCQFANVRFVHAAVNKIDYNGDPQRRSPEDESGGFIYCTDGRPPIRYDYLSFDVGVIPSSIPIQGTSIDSSNHSYGSGGDGSLSTATTVSGESSIASTNCTDFNGHDGTTKNGKAASPSHSQLEFPCNTIPVKPLFTLGKFYKQIVAKVEKLAKMESESMDVSMGSTHSRHRHKKDSDYLGGNSEVSSAYGYPLYTVVIVGAGAAGIELALSMHHHLKKIHDNVQVVIVTSSKSILMDFQPQVQEVFTRILKERNIPVYPNASVTGIEPTRDGPATQSKKHSRSRRHRSTASSKAQQKLRYKLLLKEHHTSFDNIDDDFSYGFGTNLLPPSKIVFDDCFWCTSGHGQQWVRQSTPFDTTIDGFLLVSNTLQSKSHKGIFAVGDCSNIVDYPRPKAAHYAIKAGPPLLENLIITCTNPSKNYPQDLQQYYPEQDFNAFISTGDKYAVASKRYWGMLEGNWLWDTKDSYNRAWIDKYIIHDYDVRKLELSGGNKAAFKKTMMIKLRPPPSVSDQLAKGMSTGRSLSCRIDTGNNRLMKKIEQRQRHRARLKKKEMEKKRAYRSSNPMHKTKLGIIPSSRFVGGDDLDEEEEEESNSEFSSSTELQTAPCSSHDNFLDIQTIDYFRSMVSDPYVFGKIVAVHALSNYHAQGFCDYYRPQRSSLTTKNGKRDDYDDSVNDDDEEGEEEDGFDEDAFDSEAVSPSKRQPMACALIVVPRYSNPKMAQATLTHLLAGLSDVLQDEDIKLIGGDTSEGRELSCGLKLSYPRTISTTPPLSKQGGKIGDKIIITKPLGTGALFSSNMRASCSAEMVEEAIYNMIQSNGPASAVAMENRNLVHGCTCIQGSGLIGDLLELLIANEEESLLIEPPKNASSTAKEDKSTKNESSEAVENFQGNDGDDDSDSEDNNNIEGSVDEAAAESSAGAETDSKADGGDNSADANAGTESGSDKNAEEEVTRKKTGTARLAAELNIRDIPFLQGALDASSKKIYTEGLHDLNYSKYHNSVLNDDVAMNMFPIQYPLLFDPQTAGGLLFLVDSNNFYTFWNLLKADEQQKLKEHIAIIGEIVPFPIGSNNNVVKPDDSETTKASTEASTTTPGDENNATTKSVNNPIPTAQRIRIMF